MKLRNGWPLVLGAALAACSGALLVDAGNAYPCHFSFDEQDAGAECPKGWVCGVTDRCQLAADEGIPSEAISVHPLPAYDAGVLRPFPVLLGRTVRVVARDPFYAQHLAALVGLEDGGARLFRVKDTQVLFNDMPAVDQLGMISDVLVANANGTLAVADFGKDAGPVAVNLGPPPPQSAVRNATFVRTVGADVLDGKLILVGVDKPKAGELRNDAVPGPWSDWYLSVYDEAAITDKAAPDGGVRSQDLLELRGLPRRLLELPSPGLPSFQDAALPIALTRDGFYYRSNSGIIERWVRLNDDDEPLLAPIPAVTPQEPRLHFSESGEVWAVAFGVPGNPGVLSTWRLTRGRPSKLSRAWSDCTPCPRGQVVAFTPTSAGGSSAVEVLCDTQTLDAGVGGRRSLWRVTGSTALNPFERCELTQLDAPFDLAEVAGTGASAASDVVSGRGYAVSEATGTAIALGGKHGQLWLGPSLSTARPLFLDRVPLGVGYLPLPTGNGGAELRRFAVTERYVAAELGNNSLATFPLTALTDAPLEPTVGPSALVREANGWLVSSAADLVKVDPRQAANQPPLQLSFGPRVLGPRGEPSPGPFTAEALRATADGGVSSIVLSANDSVYLYRVGTLGDAPTDRNALTPQLTPEPGFPIRSMTVDRTSSTLDFHAPPGGAGAQVLGYLVTSRNVFEFELSGAPLRWTQKQIVLTPNEPVEVWMDDATTSRGRVGFRDGTIFTLPGGFPLARALPASSSGEPDRVLDYANLGGWPIALAESGLYGSVLEKRADGSNGKLLRWERVPLPAELTPEALRASRLEVMRTVDATTERFSLVVFTPYGHVYSLPALSRQVGL